MMLLTNGRARLLLAGMIVVVAGCRSTEQPVMNEVQRVRAGAMDVVLLAPQSALPQGRGTSALEFRSPSDQRPVDVGDVKVSATMPMAGMPPMLGNISAHRTDVPGRYVLDSEFSMAGSWRIGVEWNGPAGRGTATLLGKVQ
jgi:hypothetical protein